MNKSAYAPERSGTGMATYTLVYKGGINNDLDRRYWYTIEGWRVDLKRIRIKTYPTEEEAIAAARRRWRCNN